MLKRIGLELLHHIPFTAMGAVAVAILFGGLLACLYVAIKKHHMTGPGREGREPPDEG